MKRCMNHRANPSNCGFSLIEVLVALLVLSIGLLGLAGLQTVGLRFNTQSYQRTQAVLNAYDIIDRMRSNPGGLTTDQYDNIALTQTPDNPPNPNCSTTVCDPIQMADYDIDEWLTSLGALLTQGDGVICNGVLDANLICNDDDGPNFQVGIRWVENDLNMDIRLEAQL